MVRRSTVLGGMAAVLAPLRVRAQALTPVTISMTNSDAEIPIVYAVKNGLFRRAGLDVVQVPAASGAAATAAVLGGALTITGTNLVTLAAAHVKGIPLEILATGGVFNNTTEFVAAIVKKDAPFQTARDLNGKVVGVASVGDLNAIAIMSWLDQHGGDAKSVRQVELPYSLAAAALDDGRIDIETVVQPFLSQAIASGKVRIFANVYGAIAPRFCFAVWATTASWAAANPEAARSFARVVRESEIYCNAHRAETAPLLAQLAGVDVAQVLRGGRNTFAAAFADPKDLQPLVDAAFKYGAIARNFDVAELISPAVRGLTA